MGANRYPHYTDTHNSGHTIKQALAYNLTEFKGTKEIPGASIKRLYRTLVLESAHLIWKLRCEAVIDRDNEDITEQEAYSKFKQALNRHLERDQILTSKSKWKSRYIPKGLVLQT